MSIKNSLSRYAQEQKIKRKERDSRHFAPANKEWGNSVYTFNKNNQLNISVKDKIAGNLIKSYFNLVPTPNVSKSKRMRDWLRRSSTKQLFISKPEIKQNNDKAVITIYTFDREKLFYLKKMFILNKWLNSNVLNSTFFYKDNNKSISYLIKKYNIDLLHKYNLSKYRNLTFNRKRSIIKKFISKYSIKPEIYNKTIISFLRKKEFLTNIFFFHFLKWTLSLFNIKISVISDIFYRNKQINIINLILRKKDTEKKIKFKGTFNIKLLRKINIVLLQYFIVNMNNIVNIKQKNKTYNLFNLFKHKYYNIIMRKYLRKEILIIKYLTKFFINKFKYNIYLGGLKGLLTDIYEKKVQLNIVNLKYLHLNSDIFSEAISIKLRNRTTSLLRILRKSFKLVKTFKSNDMYILSEKKKNSKINEINTFFSKYNVVNGNTLSSVFKKMFKSKIEGSHTDLNIKNTLTNLKYKWVTGLRVEAKGRLTKRYAAARAIFKYKYKGTLKNLEHIKNIENKLESPNVSMLRGGVRPNTQYSFIQSKRRIGAFGIKSWISNS